MRRYGPVKSRSDLPEQDATWEGLVANLKAVAPADGYIALYARYSAKDDDSESVPNQLAAGHRAAAADYPGVPVVEFFDDGIKASDPDIVRPGYEAMLDCARRGEVRMILTKNQTRVSRHEQIWVGFKLATTMAGITKLHCFGGGDVDLADGQSLPGDMMNLIAAEYSRQVRANVRVTLDELAAQGRPAGGKKWGYAKGRDAEGHKTLEVIEPIAEATRHMATMLLGGSSLADILRWVEDKNIPTARGGAWTTATIKAVLTCPTVTALRTHQGRIIGEGKWEPILDRDTWLAIKAHFAAPRTITRADGKKLVVAPRRPRPVRTYCLSRTIAHCGRCGHGLSGQHRGTTTRRRAEGTRPMTGKQPIYQCAGGRGGCYGIGIVAQPLEDEVLARLVTFTSKPRFRKHFAAADADAKAREALDRKAAALEARRLEGAQAAARGTLTMAALVAFEAELADQAVEIEQERAQLAPVEPTLIDLGDPDQMRAAWEQLTPNEQRELLTQLQCYVEVLPAPDSSGRWAPERVVVSFFGVKVPAAKARAKPRRKIAAA